MPSFMARKRIELVEWEAEQGEEDLRRVRDGELRREVDLAPVDEAVDEIVDQDGNLVLHRRHQAGGEDRVQQLAELLVFGRVDLERDQRPCVLEVHRGHVGREELRMAQGFVDVDLAAQDDAGALNGHDRAAVPQRLEHRLRVGRHVPVHAEGAGSLVFGCFGGCVHESSPG
jgi:hypothetical protein